jgi:hypothetical protein
MLMITLCCVGRWIREDSSIGAGIDSFFEYLYKGYILFGDQELYEIFEQVCNLIVPDKKRLINQLTCLFEGVWGGEEASKKGPMVPFCEYGKWTSGEGLGRKLAIVLAWSSG